MNTIIEGKIVHFMFTTFAILSLQNFSRNAQKLLGTAKLELLNFAFVQNHEISHYMVGREGGIEREVRGY